MKRSAWFPVSLCLVCFCRLGGVMSRRLVVLLALAVCLTAVYAAPSSAWALAFSGQPLEVGAAPQGVAVGDFNCDGIRDLVTLVASGGIGRGPGVGHDG